MLHQTFKLNVIYKYNHKTDADTHLTYADCCAEMAKKFLIGSLHGQFIDAMEKLSRHIFPIAFSNQFQDPGTANSNLFERIGERCASNADNIVDSNHDNTYVLRPSDFRLKSIVCEAIEWNEQPPTNKDDVDACGRGAEPIDSIVQSKSIRSLYEQVFDEFNRTIKWFVHIMFMNGKLLFYCRIVMFARHALCVVL